MLELLATEVEIGVCKFLCMENGLPMTYQNWIDKMKTSEEFVNVFIDALKDSHFAAYFWEVGPATTARLNETFEFVLVESSTLLSLKPDKHTFSQYFQKGRTVVSFPNLGGDAQLVVPSPIAADDCYAQLANFIRKAPREQCIDFWMAVADHFEKKIGEKPKWLSTAGLGVSWLHVRIDSRPKYYRYGPYRKEFIV